MFESRNVYLSCKSGIFLSFIQRLNIPILLLTVTLTTASFAASNYDGPAKLPRVSVPSAMSNTPAPGVVISVAGGGDLQSALNNAVCGDTIELEAGAAFSGKFIVPAKDCDINHWIIIRTSSPAIPLCRRKGSAPHPAMPASLPSKVARSIAAPRPRT